MGVVTVVSSASAAAAGAAALGSDRDEEASSEGRDGQESALPPIPPADPSLAIPIVGEAPILQSVIEERISNFKEMVGEEELLNTLDQSVGHEDAAFGEKVRSLGAVLAHQTLDGISELTSCIPHLLEEIKDMGCRISPESLLSFQDVVEITPVKNFDSLIAAGHEKIDQVFSTDQAGLYTNEVKQAGNSFAIGILPPPGTFIDVSASIPKLAEAGKAIDRAGFTKAGRGLMKHGYREGSTFPKPAGTPAQINERGQQVLESILTHPQRQIIPEEFRRYGKVIDIYAPDIGGIRYSVEGDFIGFLEPLK